MGFHHYPPNLALEAATLSGLANMRARVLDAETDTEVTVYRNERPLAALITGPRGYIEGFQTEDTTRRVRVEIGDVALYMWADEAIGRVLDAAEGTVVDTGTGVEVDVAALATKTYASQVAQSAAASVRAGVDDTLTAYAQTADMLAADQAVAQGYQDADAALSARLDALASAGSGAGEMVMLSATVKGDGSDESAAVQAAVTRALTEGRLLVCDVPGVIGLGSMVTLGDERANGDQRNILTFMGSLRVKALTSMDTLLRVSGTVQNVGQIEADGAGKASFSVYFKNYGRMTLDRVHALGALVSGVAGEPSGNNNSWTINKLRVITSGSKVVTTATVAARSAESGWASTGDSAPYTTWTLDTPMPAHMVSREWAAPAVLFSGGRAMAVRRVVDARTVEVFNEDRPVGTTDTLTLATAAVAFPYYGDVGIWTIGNADVRQNPNAWAMNYGGYGGFIGQWAQQANLAGVSIPKWAIGLTFGAFYTELSGSAGQGTPWLAVRSTAMTTVSVGPGTNGEPDSWQGMDLGWMTMTGRNRQPLHWQVFRKGASPIVPPPAVPLDLPELQPGTRNLTPGTAQAYRRTSGAWALRIDAKYQNGVGIVHLSSPTVGTGTPLSVTLLNAPAGQTVNAPSGTFGDQSFAYWREGDVWQVKPLGAPAQTLTRVDSAPPFVGAIAVTGGQAYISVGTSSASDWKQATS